MVLNPCDENRSSCVSHCVLMKYLSIVWCLCTPYLFIDASTEGYEEEGDYEEKEEEHFDNCTNQGKLYQCKLARITLQFIYLWNLTHPKFLPCKLLPFYLSKSFIVHLCLSISITTRSSSLGQLTKTQLAPLTNSYYTLTSCQC